MTEKTEWEKACRVLLAEGLISGGGMINGRACASNAEVKTGWARIAKRLSQELSGQLIPTMGGGVIRLSSQKGQRGGRVTGYLIQEGDLKETLRARANLATLGLEDEEIPWNVTGCAGRLLKYVGEPQKFEKSAAFVWRGRGKIFYHECAPGKYKDLSYWDVRACFYTLLCRLPSLYVSIGPNDIDFFSMPPGARERWRDVQTVVTYQKLLRNSMWGRACGNTPNAGPRIFYHRGNRKEFRGGPGPFAAAAWLVAASAWDLNRAAAEETGAVYGTADSIIAPITRAPAAWRNAGLDYEAVPPGAAEICHRGSYLVAGKQTQTYYNGSRAYKETPRPPSPPCNYAPQWVG